MADDSAPSNVFKRSVDKLLEKLGKKKQKLENKLASKKQNGYHGKEEAVAVYDAPVAVHEAPAVAYTTECLEVPRKRCEKVPR